MSLFDEIISLSLNGIIIFPFIFYFKSYDNRWLYIALYSFLNIQIHDIIKNISVYYDYDFLKRPFGAMNCDMFSRNGLVERQPGFPSGHVTSTVSLFTGIALLFPEYRNYAIVFGIAHTLLMAKSRINKKCHTVVQTIAGAFLGLVGTYLLNKYIK
jgi:membrane-associated phospholipid phosphatase